MHDSQLTAQSPDTVVGPRLMAYQGEQSGAMIGTPPPRPQNLARPIQIEQLNHGYIIVVGCQRFAIESKDALLHRLSTYLSDPSKVEEEWSSGRLKF